MVPTWYWVAAGVLLVWNLIGCAACFSQMTANMDKIAKMPPAQRDAWMAMPGTARIAYAVAVIAGLLGSVALLLQYRVAGPLFIASLVGIIVQFGWFFVVWKGASKAGGASMIFPGVITAIAIAQIGFACWAKTQGILV